jgi:hypothetical protein
LPNPSCGTIRWFRQIPVLAGWGVILQKTQQLSPADRIARRLDQECAAAARSDNQVNFLHQILRQQDMCAFAFHGEPTYVPTKFITGMCFVIPRHKSDKQMTNLDIDIKSASNASLAL